MKLSDIGQTSSVINTSGILNRSTYSRNNEMGQSTNAPEVFTGLMGEDEAEELMSQVFVAWYALCALRRHAFGRGRAAPPSSQ